MKELFFKSSHNPEARPRLGASALQRLALMVRLVNAYI